MNKQMTDLFKRIWLILLITSLLITMMPLTLLSGDSIAYGAAVGTFRYGSAIRDSKGNTYNWKKSQMAPAYWWDAKGNRVADKAATFESSTAGIEKYLIRTGSKTITGYCIAHGIRVDTTTNLTGKQSLEDWAHTGAYPKSSQKGIEYALIYGYQPGRHISDLADMGFTKSSYWHKTASSYTLDDWYIATQVLIWEYQQLIRTDSVKGGHDRTANGLVNANHYFNIISGRAASDIYHYMATCIKRHWKITSFAKEKKETAENSKGWLLKKDPSTGYYTCTLKDGNNIEADIEASGTSAKNWEVTKNGNTYTFTFKGKKLSEAGTVFKFAKKIPIQEKYNGGGMLIWSWSSSGSLRQAIATGVPESPVSMYIKFRSGEVEQPVGDEPEPDYWPIFEFPVHKDDKNPGWDGDSCTPMGDATLASTFVLYRNGEEVDRVTLDDYGSTEILSDQPWTSMDDLTKTSSGSCIHQETDAEGNTTTHCTVTPTRLEWKNTEKVEYEIIEIPATARFTEADSGTGANNRTYTADFYAITQDARTCITHPTQWSDIQYTINYRTTLGTNAGNETVQGTKDDLDDQLTMNEETWINDNWRGKLLIKKQKESENVFHEEGSSGSLNLSTKSKWKMYLNSGGYEDHPYLRFVEDGHTEDGAKKYKVVRDTSGIDNATVDMVVSDTGSLFIIDIPYGTYTVEEVKADDESFVLESFQVDITEDGKQYTKSITNKKKENVIKVVKTDAETGKQVNMKGTKFYIQYMGNQLLEDPSKSENYGRLLPNAADINSTSKDYTFTCNSYGEIVLPYDLEFGTYRLEEFLLPDGYFVGKYGGDGKGHNADYGESGEYGKDDDGKADASMSWETVRDDDPSNDLVAVYDKDGNKLEYKAGDIFNFYTFKVEKQDAHMDGEEYTKYYKAVAMKNNPVKGKIEISKEGEILAGFEKTQKDGFTIWTPKYVWGKLKDAVYEVYAAIDEWLSDGNDGSSIYDAETGKEIKIPTDKKTHSGENGSGKIYEEGTLDHESGAKLYYQLGREASLHNRYTRIYTTPEQKPTTYKTTIERTEDGLKYRYDIEVNLTYNAGGLNYSDVRITKVTSVQSGFSVSIPTTDATSVVGGVTYNPAIDVGDADGNVFDISKETYTYEADGSRIYDADGKLVYDLADIGAKRYMVRDHHFYKLTETDLVKEERIVEEGVDLDGDGKYDGEGEKEPVKETKTAYEWAHGAELVNPAVGGKAVIRDGENFKVETTGYLEDAKEVEKTEYLSCDENGTLPPQYTVPDGWRESLYIPDISVDEGEVTVGNSHYAIISRTDETTGETQYRVLLDDLHTWQDCDVAGNFKKMVVEEYQSSYTQQADNENGFTFELDGITISSQALKDGTAKTVIDSPYDVTPVIGTGIGYTQETDGNTTTFTAKEPSAPLYFLSGEDIRTEMYYFGNSTRTLLTIPMKAAEGNYEKVIPSIKFTRTGENVDWFSKLSPDKPEYTRECAYGNTVKAIRHEGGKDSDVYYTVEIVSNQTNNTAEGDEAGDGPFEITYPDGYTARVYRDKSASGNDVGVLVMDGEYKTSTAALSDLVDTITTGEDGKAVSKELPLGKYIIRELSAPEGYVADTEKTWEVDLQYKDQYTPLVWKAIKAKNEYVSVELDLSKVFETGVDTDNYIPGEGAVFGIYNADPIAYGVGTLKADTLVDTLKVGSDGKALSASKLPEGVYYLKELKTRDGYILNDTPFYFVAGDAVKSGPLDISKDEDGKDTDGMTAKAVMDGCGQATITVETLNRYPAASMTINGKAYVLDQDVEDPYATIKVHKDMSRTRITVTEDNPATIKLTNGKILTMKVEGNTYSYNYDGTEGTYIPTIMNTGYYADYTLPEKQADLKNPVDRVLVLTAADGTSAVTAQTVHEKQMKQNPENTDNPADFVEILDKDGNPVFDQYVNVSLTTGTLISATLGKDDIDPATLEGAIRLEKGQKLVLKGDDNTRYIITMDKDGNVKTSVSNAIAKAITDANAPKLTIDGVDTKDGFNLVKSITTARQDSSAKTVQVKIHTTDNINGSAIKNKADKVPDIPVTPPGSDVTPKQPSIKTTAKDSDTGSHMAKADHEVTIIDTVAYYNLEVGKTYTLKGHLVDKSSGKVLKINGTEIKTEKTFTPKETDGKIALTFTFDGSVLAGKGIVVFEALYAGQMEIAKHTDIEDEDQAIYFPAIKTMATDGETKDHITRADKDRTIVDVIEYSNLIPGNRYSITGVLVDRASGKSIQEKGKKITATKIFTAEQSEGTVELAFSFDASDLSETTIVAFESLTYDDIEIADHKDVSDKRQTVYVPEIKTSASHGKKGLITDTVKYSNLLPGRVYTVCGVLMDQATGKPVVSGGQVITAEKEFVPELPRGTVELDFHFDEKELYGKTVVAFETLKLERHVVGVHQDLHDKAQTVEIEAPTSKIVKSKSDVPKTGDIPNMRVFGILILAVLLLSLLMARRKNCK